MIKSVRSREPLFCVSERFLRCMSFYHRIDYNAPNLAEDLERQLALDKDVSSLVSAEETVDGAASSEDPGESGPLVDVYGRDLLSLDG